MQFKKISEVNYDGVTSLRWLVISITVTNSILLVPLYLNTGNEIYRQTAKKEKPVYTKPSSSKSTITLYH